MELKLKIYVTDQEGNKFLGIGVLWLLEHIRQHGSIRAAAVEMGISYSKAYRMLCCLEDALGKPVIERKKGGSSRDGAELTSLGDQVIRKYALMSQSIKAAAWGPFLAFTEEMKEVIDEQKT